MLEYSWVMKSATDTGIKMLNKQYIKVKSFGVRSGLGINILKSITFKQMRLSNKKENNIKH